MKRIKTLTSMFFLTLFSVLFTPAAHSEKDPPQLLPYDEAERDESLLAFRARMIQVLAFKEPERLVEMIDPKMSNGLNAESGTRAFVDLWRPETMGSEIWQVLSPILKLGGGFVRSENGVMFCAPYIFVNFPAELDVFSHGVVTQAKINLKQKPTTASTTITILNYDILQVEDWSSVNDDRGTENLQWIKVSTMDDEEGYVQRNVIRSPSDYSACFIQRKNKGWKLLSLVSRD